MKNRRTSWKGILVVALLLMGCLMAMAGPVSATPKITAAENTSEYSRSVSRGSSTTFDVLLTNQDATPNTVDLVYNEPTNFVVTTNATNDQVTLAGYVNGSVGDVVLVGITVTARSRAASGEIGDIEVDFKVGTSVEQTLTFTVTVNVEYGVTLSSEDASLTTGPGMRAAYRISIKNSGNTQDIFTLTMSGLDVSGGWTDGIKTGPSSTVTNPGAASLTANADETGYNSIGLLTSKWVTGLDATSILDATAVMANAQALSAITVAAGATSDFYVYHCPPATATNGTADTVIVKAESQLNSTASATITLVTTVLTSQTIGISMTTDSTAATIEPDEMAEFTITIENTGTVEVSVYVTAISDALLSKWTIELDDDTDHSSVDAKLGEAVDTITLTIPVNQSTRIYLLVTAPSATEISADEEISVVVHAVTGNRILERDYIDYGGTSGDDFTGDVSTPSADSVPGFEGVLAFVAISIVLLISAIFRKRRN